METPKEWPKEIAESYDPMRVLGSGGFASVVLARKKNSDKISAEDIPARAISVATPKRVAVKVVGCNDGTGNYVAAVLYARREIELLQQIRHCGIVKLFHSWERENNNEKENSEDRSRGFSPTAGVLVLEYLKGPTVESLLKHGGALSNTFGRVIIAQVMDAIAYLHYRAVLHRDIKPDNIIVTGAFSSDASIWDNEDDENPFKCQDEKSPEVWKELCLRYKATIIDFGFARALTPVDLDDVSHEESSSQERHPNKENAGYQNVGRDQQISKAQKQKKALERGSNGNSGPLRNLFRNLSKTSLVSLNEMDDSVHSLASVSHKMKRVMSTLGNRNYAAPEIVNKVREFSAQDKKKETQKDIQQKKTASETTKTISEFVADYGVLVDSYSMGHTIRYMMTGVMPGVSVEDTIKKQQRAGRAKKVFSKLGMSKKKKAAAGKGPRKPRYRSLYDLPGQLFLLVERLTEVSPYNRMSIRNARRTVPWVRDVLSFQEQPKNIHDGLDGPTDTGTPTEALQELSLEYVSEEQLHSLRETRYLPLATTTPGSIVSIHGSRRSIGGATAYTVQTTEESIHDFQLDNSSDSSNNPAAEGVGLEDDILTF